MRQRALKSSSSSQTALAASSCSSAPPRHPPPLARPDPYPLSACPATVCDAPANARSTRLPKIFVHRHRPPMASDDKTLAPLNKRKPNRAGPTALSVPPESGPRNQIEPVCGVRRAERRTGRAPDFAPTAVRSAPLRAPNAEVQFPPPPSSATTAAPLWRRRPARTRTFRPAIGSPLVPASSPRTDGKCRCCAAISWTPPSWLAEWTPRTYATASPIFIASRKISSTTMKGTTPSTWATDSCRISATHLRSNTVPTGRC